MAQQWRDETVRNLPFMQQTVIQVFYTRDGAHREEDSVNARIGNDNWKEVSISLPAGAAVAPLRIDFVSALTTIDLASIILTRGGRPIFVASASADFDNIVVAGDAERVPHNALMRLRITGLDPQLILPPIKLAPADYPLEVRLHLYVHSEVDST